jgi:UDP-glucose 4-epimerase
VEDFLGDLVKANPNWRVANLRYFNPAGAHSSGMLGESPRGRPNNLVPLLGRVAVGEIAELRIYGDDWPTPDGTGVRDYLHVVDLAEGHVAALRHLAAQRGVTTLNLGTGRGYSVLEVIAAFERACGHAIAHRIVSRRAGDIASCFANSARANKLLGWRAERAIDAICADAWRWETSTWNASTPR